LIDGISAPQNESTRTVPVGGFEWHFTYDMEILSANKSAMTVPQWRWSAVAL